MPGGLHRILDGRPTDTPIGDTPKGFALSRTSLLKAMDRMTMCAGPVPNWNACVFFEIMHSIIETHYWCDVQECNNLGC